MVATRGERCADDEWTVLRAASSLQRKRCTPKYEGALTNLGLTRPLTVLACTRKVQRDSRTLAALLFQYETVT